MSTVRFIFVLLIGGACHAAVPATAPTPDVVILKQLATEYQPVPFDHQNHAKMAEMWTGCTTCHHRHSAPSTAPTTQPCRTCHSASAADPDLHRPSLKGAYHRQCLNCHREWANETSCEVCHLRAETAVARATTVPSVDDIVGRMHPPIPEPQVMIYRARFTPAVGANVIFRHKEHTTSYDVKCVSCHRRDTCADCHDGKASTLPHKPIHPGRTWRESHAPCVSCHEKDRCNHCHFDQTPPPAGRKPSTTQQQPVRHAATTRAITPPSTRAVIQRIRR